MGLFGEVAVCKYPFRYMLAAVHHIFLRDGCRCSMCLASDGHAHKDSAVVRVLLCWRVLGANGFQSKHDQIGAWYIRHASSTSVLSDRTYFVVFLAGLALEF